MSPRRGATHRPKKWGTTASAKLTAAVLRRDHDPAAGYTPCYWCGKPADTADHYPIGRDEGGSDTLDNLVSACRPCNSARGAAYTNAKRAVDPGPSRDW